MAKNKKIFYLYDSIELIKQLKPAFEEEVSEEKDFSKNLPEDLSQLSVSSNKSCSTCGVNFELIEDQRAHFKLEWHRFNIASKLKGQKPITEEQFEAQLDNLSLSGSESETEESETEILQEKTAKLAKVFYTHCEKPQQVYSIHKVILPDFRVGSDLKWAIFMLGGGHFAGAIFDKNNAILHKTFHCYTVRAKQGGSQGSADNRSGSSHPKSAGASLRRYNEASLAQHVLDILSAWKQEIGTCSLIFFRAVSGNQRILFAKNGKDPAILDKNDPRCISIPFPTRRATFKEVKRVHETLMTIQLHNETLQELRDNLLKAGNQQGLREGHRSSTSPRKKQIRRSKSRESPKRELPDFVQTLASEAASESEEEVGFLSSDLQEFEATTKKASEKKAVNRKIELQNSLVTACKSGDVKLLSLLSDVDDEKILNEPLGEARLTLLHIAAKEGHAKTIQFLLEKGADPTSKDKVKKTAYSYCPDKNSRTAFRRFQAQFPEQWDYVKAGLPKGQLLTPEEEARQASKKTEKKKAQRAAKKEKEKEEKEAAKEKKMEEAEKQRFLELSDREKRALAAERRILAQQEALPSVSRCFQCGVDISGKVPFEYSDYRFCKPACVKEHRKHASKV